MEKKKVKIEEKATCEILAELLRKMALDLENGQMEIRSADKTISLSVPESMPVEIEAKQKENKEKFVIELSWRNLTVTELGEETLAELEETTGAVSIESTCGVEPAIQPGEAVGGGSSVVPESVEETMETCCNEVPCGVKTDFLSEESVVGESSVAPEPDETTTDIDNNESAYGVEPDSLNGEAAAESTPEVTELVAEELAENIGKPKTRTVRRRK